jgi:hypothetical protein
VPLGMALLQGEILALDVAERVEPLPEAVEERAGRKTEMEPTDPDDFARWLCDGGQWRRKDAQGKEDDEPKRAAPHNALLF